MKECIIIRNHFGFYDAYAYNGRFICGGMFWQMIQEALRDRGYVSVPLNSRAGRTILDLAHKTCHPPC